MRTAIFGRPVVPPVQKYDDGSSGPIARGRISLSPGCRRISACRLTMRTRAPRRRAFSRRSIHASAARLGNDT
ncbi:Uncharacterised protein [Burkholderia pseudomallei]|nr:Uncharacterised protein [Burkholderia pseudomallei]CAJ6402530.1 Uncharacterised protein [Burkholderia pseudomallei]CAJ8320611.1 Uncharacterised protein [Burkholderia pseudomallei]CAJ9920433.1 Uncharacterised protein [Burkholderia pseudomallei]VCD17638.1 Uncharacterised protein [Burkholderia pseudomallei]